MFTVGDNVSEILIIVVIHYLIKEKGMAQLACIYIPVVQMKFAIPESRLLYSFINCPH